MSKKQNIVALFSLLTLFLVACGSEQTATNPSDSSSLLPAAAKATKITTIKTTPSPTATLLPTATLTPTIQPTPTLLIGEEIVDMSLKRGWTIRRTNLAPQSTQQEIMQTLGWSNSPGISLTATFGLVTFEKGLPKCLSYDGPTCPTSSPTVVPFVNRPAWIFSFDGLTFAGSSPPCERYIAYRVYVVDDQSREILATFGGNYGMPIPTPTPSTPRRLLPVTPIPTPDKVGSNFDFPPLERYSLTLRRVAEKPKHTVKEVQQFLHDVYGIDYAFGGEYKGHLINVTALYGLGTMDGQAQLAWVMDYGNMPNLSVPNCYGENPKIDDHMLFYVDAETLKMIFESSYNLAAP